MSEETATPEEDAPDGLAEGAGDADTSAEGVGDAGTPAHSPDPQDQAESVRAGTDTADADSEAVEADDAGSEAAAAEEADSEAVVADEADSQAGAADDGGVEAVAADDADAGTDDGGDASAPDEKPQAAGEKPQAKPAVPGADLEPIALESDENLSAEERARIEAEAEEEQARREAELAAENADEDFPVREPAKLEKDARFRATGKRKSAIARVILLPGSGQITINGRDIDEYFPRALNRSMVRQPLVATGYDSSLDVRVRVHGGGVSGQASAVRHGVARALTEIDGELRGDLKRRGYLTRDARVKERRKAGLKKARKRPQFSKR